MRFLLVKLSFILFLTNTLFGQSSERPEGIVIPVSGIGNVSETRKLILQNTLIESLSEFYRLVPQDKFEEVQEKVFQELDYEQCTEDQCIVMIQDMLQVENLFVLQVIGEGQDTQLSLKWVGLDDKKVKTEVCKGCDTFELNERVEGLVKNLEILIPRGGVLSSENDEKLRKRREEELQRQREEELRKQKIYKQEDKNDFNSLKIVEEIYQNRKYTITGMYGSSDIHINEESSTTSKYIGVMVFNGFGFGLNYYIWDNYHINTNYYYGTLFSISMTTLDKTTTYESYDTSYSEYYDMYGETLVLSGSINRSWDYKKWNFWSGVGLYFESGTGTIITTDDLIYTYFELFGPIYDGGFEYNFENLWNLSFRLNYGFIPSSITQQVNYVNHQTDVLSSIKIYFGVGYNL